MLWSPGAAALKQAQPHSLYRTTASSKGLGLAATGGQGSQAKERAQKGRACEELAETLMLGGHLLLSTCSKLGLIEMFNMWPETLTVMTLRLPCRRQGWPGDGKGTERRCMRGEEPARWHLLAAASWVLAMEQRCCDSCCRSEAQVRIRLCLKCSRSSSQLDESARQRSCCCLQAPVHDLLACTAISQSLCQLYYFELCSC